MSFSQDAIVDVKPPVWDGSALHLEWNSAAPPATVFQVYVSRALAWHGTSHWVTIPLPSSRVRIDVGTVGPGEGDVDFSSLLPPAPSDRAQLNWLGGSYLDPGGKDSVGGFRIHGETTAGGGIDYSSTLGEIRAYPAGILTDGHGLGGFGQGGYGRAASAYRWTSRPLAPGTWSFVVVPIDTAGNPGASLRTSVTISSPPQPPAPFPDGRRLRYVYDPTNRKVTLSWKPVKSP